MSFASLEPNCPGAENVPFAICLVADWLASSILDIEGMRQWRSTLLHGTVSRETAKAMMPRMQPWHEKNTKLMTSLSLCSRYLWHALRPGAIEVWRAAIGGRPKGGFVWLSDRMPSPAGLEYVAFCHVEAVGEKMRWLPKLSNDPIMGMDLSRASLKVCSTSISLEEKVVCALNSMCRVFWPLVWRKSRPISSEVDYQVRLYLHDISPLRILEFERALVASGFTIVLGFSQ